MIAIIDNSGIAYDRMHSLNATSPSLERKEFRRAYAEKMNEIFRILDPQHSVLALDSLEGYWRHEVYDAWYETHCECCYDQGHNVWFRHDNKMEKVIQAGAGSDDTICIPVKKDTEGLQDVLSGQASKWLPYSMFIKDATVPKACVADAKEHRPKYKGKRKKSQWNFTMDKKTFTTLRNEVGREIAHVFGCRVVELPLVEADDIAAVVTGKMVKQDEEVVLVTGDSDWEQLCTNPLVKVFDFGKMEFKEVTDPGYALRVKLLCGDSSDNISGMAFPGKSNCLGETGAKNMLAEFKLDPQGIVGKAKAEGWDDQLARNIRLIDFRSIPENIQKKVWAACRAADTDDSGSLESFGFTKQELRIMRFGAMGALGKKQGETP